MPTVAPGPSSLALTFLFSDIEGSTRHWEQEPADRMRPTIAKHDELVRGAVEANSGEVVKMTGDGVHAVFQDPLNAVSAALRMQIALQELAAVSGVPLKVRCGLHVGESERRDNDFFGAVVNRAARIMSAAHGGQILLSQAVVDELGGRLTGQCSLLDLGAVRLRDLASPQRLYQATHPDLPSAFPALRSLESTPNNLPQQLTSFVGRQQAREECKAILSRARLLTILGAGGLGKSRLALHVAADLMDEHADGVWLVELASVSDERRIPQSLAAVLGVREDSGASTTEALAAFVRTRRILIVLDNCEHLISGCAAIAKSLLQAAPGVRILATSREPLRISGESILALHSLELPQVASTSAAKPLQGCEAVQMFIERAVSAAHDFRLTASNATLVGDICSRLDGIPLAIELAAARVRTLSLETIAARLKEPLRLLTGGDRSASARQQTLRSSISWSHELLSEKERGVFARLSIFAGGWTLEAAQEVCANDVLDATEVVDVITQLVDKSLVTRHAQHERYHMLETVRDFAREQLVLSGQTEATRAVHLGFYESWAKRIEPSLVKADQGHWNERLLLDRSNLLAALDSGAISTAASQQCLRLARSLSNHWIHVGANELGYRVTLDALRRDGAQIRNRERGEAMHSAGLQVFVMGNPEKAKGHFEECVSIFHELGEREAEADALALLGPVCAELGDLDSAILHLETAERLAHTDKALHAKILNNFGRVQLMRGDRRSAEQTFQRSLSLARESGHPDRTLVGLINLISITVEPGATSIPYEVLSEAISMSVQLRSRDQELSVLEACAGSAAVAGDIIQAARWFGSAEADRAKSLQLRQPSQQAWLEALVRTARDALGDQAFNLHAESAHALSPLQALGDAQRWVTSKRRREA